MEQESKIMVSKIPWTEQTLEVTGGCTECSTGCRECYARGLIWRLAHNPVCGDKYKGLVKKVNGKLQWTGKVVLFPEHLDQPVRRKIPTTYFIDSRSDLFHKSVPFEFVDKVMAVIALCPQHIFQVLTKRPKGMAEYFSNRKPNAGQWNVLVENVYLCKLKLRGHGVVFPPPNLHLGVTAENQEMADKRIPILLRIPAVKRFVSIEPMLGEVSLTTKFGDGKGHNPAACIYDDNQNDIDWVIIGCESGASRRPCKLEWVRSIVKQCKSAGVKVFVKQVPMWVTKLPESLLREAPIVKAYFETKEEALEWACIDKPKLVLVKDISKFPADLQVQEKL